MVNELPWIAVTEHTVPCVGLREPFTILQLSDVHLRGRDAWTERLVEIVAGLRADLVVLTGDVVTRGWTREAADLLLAAVPDAPLGKWAIMGNWEYWGQAPPETWRFVLERHGIRLLHDASADLGHVQLVGTDDMLAGRPDLDRAFAAVDPSRPTVVLTHSPGLFPRLVRTGVRLVLAGHTHGGQVRLPGLGPFFLPRASGPYPWGWYEQDGVWLFVCRGVGWSVAPVRWRAAPELALIRVAPDPRAYSAHWSVVNDDSSSPSQAGLASR
jgi:predicted MPP superfamily phosphohydrolase